MMELSFEWVESTLTWLKDPSTSDQDIKIKQKFASSTPNSHPSNLTAVGKSNPLLTKKASELSRILKLRPFEEILEGVTNLWKHEILESRILACKLLSKFKKSLDQPTWNKIDTEWIDLIDHWTSADHLCIDVLSHFPITDESQPYFENLKQWSAASNPWRRRVALVTFVRAVRTNSKAVAMMERILEKIIEDDDYYVRKAIPWILRESTKSDSLRVKEFLERHEKHLKKSEIKEIVRKLRP